MLPLPHRLRVIVRQQAAAHEYAQQPPAHLCLHLGDGVGLEPGGGMENHPAGGGGVEHAVDDDAPGRDSALLRHPPLRTVRDSFPSHGSSLYQGTLRHPVQQLRVAALCCFLRQVRCSIRVLLAASVPPSVRFTIC